MFVLRPISTVRKLTPTCRVFYYRDHIITSGGIVAECHSTASDKLKAVILKELRGKPDNARITSSSRGGGIGGLGGL